MTVTLQGVGHTHANGTRALAGVDLHLPAGSCVAVIGSSGAGKSTLLQVLGAALMPSEGQVQVLDQSVRGLNAAQLRQLQARIGTVYQSSPLPLRQRVVTAVLAGKLGQWPLWKSLASWLYPQDVAGARAALERVQLADKLFVRCDELSGGQMQRVGIARVLHQQPALWLADEPVSALDPTLAQSTVQLLSAQARSSGATLVASLHTVELALNYFDRVVGLREGRVAFDLPAAEVTPAHLQALYAQVLGAEGSGDVAGAVGNPPQPVLRRC